MPQTLLAVSALVITILMAFSSQESVVRMERTSVQQEVETLAGQAGMNVLAYIAAQPFDAATVAGTVSVETDLTPAASFPTGLAFSAAADVDDFHQMTTYDYVSTDGLTFQIDAEVHYVDESMAVSSSQTYQKEVVLTIEHERLAVPLTLRRVVSWS